MSTVAAALTAARARVPAAEARQLLGHVLERPAAWLLAHDDLELGEDQLRAFASMVARRAGGEPVAYLIGYREFYGRRFRVTPATLIPRPETELLVDLVKAKVGATGTAKILDLGTGSGCIAVTLALELPMARVTAIDSSAAALSIAAGNAKGLGATLRMVQGDWYDALEPGRFDIIVSNPPYIAFADPHLESGDLRHEPRSALAGGEDGLDAIRRIVSGASERINPGGALYIEHGHDQAGCVQGLFCDNGLLSVRGHRDLAGIVRVTEGHSAGTNAALVHER